MFYGSIAYEWQGTTKRALAAPWRRGETPAAIVKLRDDFVTVGRLVGGTEIVAWESVLELRGWAPVSEEDRR